MACIRFLILASILLPSLRVNAQSSNVKIEAGARSQTIKEISRLLLANYVHPDTAKRMSEFILKRSKNGAYDTITDVVRFADALNTDLYSIYHDGHLLVQYNPALSAALLDPEPAEPVDHEANLRRLKKVNFGLNKVEILNGNIGYINIEKFWADGVHGNEAVRSAMRFVSNADALIIDVRNCGGGSQQTVSMICSYFFDKKVHMNSMYDRAAKSTTEYWTSPDSTFPSLVKMPLYILASNRTFSAAEEFCYDLQARKRAVIVGERTGGGAHGTFEQPAGNGFVLFIPYSKAINPVTNKNWEGSGVKPDHVYPADEALSAAQLMIFERKVSMCKDSMERFELHWQLEILEARISKVDIDEVTLNKFAGVYGNRNFTFENGKLFYQREGRPKFELMPMTKTMMTGKDNPNFRIEFIEENGTVNRLIAYYWDGRVEHDVRTK